MSSSRELVAAFRLTKSVALSLLRLLSCAISRCKFVAIVVRCSICVETNPSCAVLVRVGVEFVMSLNGVSGTCMFCKASMVADGGVFSPRIALGGCLVDGRRAGVSFKSREAGVGVVDRSGDFSGEL